MRPAAGGRSNPHPKAPVGGALAKPPQACLAVQFAHWKVDEAQTQRAPCLYLRSWRCLPPGSGANAGALLLFFPIYPATTDQHPSSKHLQAPLPLHPLASTLAVRPHTPWPFRACSGFVVAADTAASARALRCTPMVPGERGRLTSVRRRGPYSFCSLPGIYDLPVKGS